MLVLLPWLLYPGASTRAGLADRTTDGREVLAKMSKQAGGRPAKSGTRRELKTFRLVPNAIERLEQLARERGGSTSDVLNEVLLESADVRPRRLEVVNAFDAERSPAVARFRVLPGGSKPAEDQSPKLAHEVERLRDSLGGVLAEIENLMAEQLIETQDGEYGSGFRAGMLEALETAYALLQTELLISDTP